MRKFTKESTTYFVRGPVCRWRKFKKCDQNQVNMFVKTKFFTNCWRSKIDLESHFEEHAKKFGRNCMNPLMQTTLLNTYLQN